MSVWVGSDRRIGLWSVSGVVALWLSYVCVGVIAVIARLSSLESPSVDLCHGCPYVWGTVSKPAACVGVVAFTT